MHKQLISTSLPVHKPHIFYDKRAKRWGLIRCTHPQYVMAGSRLNCKAADFVLYKNKQMHQSVPTQETLI